ncbi:MAG: hypothetical protein WC791_00910 [Candidatus Paceibacterota bacterium]|jgi:hypothetical protein
MDHYKESLKAAILWLERLRNEPANYVENIKFFRQNVLEGNLMLSSLATKDYPRGTSEEELAYLRKKHYEHGALITLNFIGKMKKEDQVPGNPVYDLYMEELHKDKVAGNISDDALKKLVANQRETDYFGPQKSSRKFPPLPQKGTPEFTAVLTRALECKKDAARWLERLRTEELTVEKYRQYLRNLRITMKAGFEESFYILQDIDPKATRAELDALNPERIKKSI